MQELIERIRKDGRIKPGNVLKVDSFLNHQIDPKLAYAMAQEIKRLYADETVNKVLTIEASGIGLAVAEEIITALDGTLDIKSTLGRGTVVTLGLPLYHKA